MTLSIRKNIPTELEQKYSEMRKQSDITKKSPNMVKDVAADATASVQIDTVTLSSRQTDSGSLPKVVRSQPVSPIEKKALQSQFSIHA